jgi:5-methylcytosine-specific restriction protein A
MNQRATSTGHASDRIRLSVVLSDERSSIIGMQVGGITRKAILAAMGEHDRIGWDVFHATYGFQSAADFALVHEKRRYDPMAIAGVAHRYDFGRALTPSEFSIGTDHVVSWLRREGFMVLPSARDFLRRVGDVRPSRRASGQLLHRPLLLLWAISQAVAGEPRLRPWSAERLVARLGLVEPGEHVLKDGHGA